MDILDYNETKLSVDCYKYCIYSNKFLDKDVIFGKVFEVS